MDLNKFLFNIVSKGLNIQSVFDIGAHIGLWSMNLRNNVLHSSNFFLFEGNPKYEQDLKRTSLPYIITVLSNPGRGEVEFFNGTNTGDSYYKETTAIYDQMGSVRVPTHTLDDIIEHFNLPIPQLIKLDTQGAELDILRGAEKHIMGKTELLLTEMPIVEYNRGAPKFSEYIDYMRSFDYIPIDVFQIHRAEETLLQVDLMFMLRSAKYKFLGENNVIRV